jgi:hypothetical protein
MRFFERLHHATSHRAAMVSAMQDGSVPAGLSLLTWSRHVDYGRCVEQHAVEKRR